MNGIWNLGVHRKGGREKKEGEKTSLACYLWKLKIAQRLNTNLEIKKLWKENIEGTSLASSKVKQQIQK